MFWIQDMKMLSNRGASNVNKVKGLGGRKVYSSVCVCVCLCVCAVFRLADNNNKNIQYIYLGAINFMAIRFL